ncbi:MAG: hypothetical protein RL095_945 [Verrucomicrobiota bacterium]|jgi:short-subunit dehydrogenase
MRLKDRYGAWALVTGASSGIGRVFADKLAKQGFDLLICARRQELLVEVAKDLSSRHGCQVKIQVADLSRPEGTESLISSCRELDISFVISNAGTGWPGAFGAVSCDEEKQLIQLNCLTPMSLAHHFLPRMKSARRGGLILVSSLMGFQGVPFMASYSATKAYLLNFGEALFHECREEGVDVLVLAPGATETPGKYLHEVDYDKLPVSWMTADEVVELALNSIGKQPFVIPGFKNRFTACLSGGLWSRGWVQSLMRRMARRVIPGLRRD